MDGEEGKTHPELGGEIMHKLFDWKLFDIFYITDGKNTGKSVKVYYNIWGNFSLYHSRYYANLDNEKHSKLCVADKLAFCIMPCWLVVFLTKLSGEVYEYMELIRYTDPKEWYKFTKKDTLEWISKNKWIARINRL